MFDGTSFPKSLDEDLFDQWLEMGRTSKIRYSFLLVIWNEFDASYSPVYAEHRKELYDYEKYHGATGYESIVAAYDLFSESRIDL